MITTKLDKTNEIKQEIIYPCYMQTKKGLIVLMIQKGTGVVVKGDESSPNGYLYDEWNMEMFERIPSGIEIISSNT